LGDIYQVAFDQLTERAYENGDVQQSHHRFKRAVEHALLLRGRRLPRKQNAVLNRPAKFLSDFAEIHIGTHVA
jgi:hypothetical protein